MGTLKVESFNASYVKVHSDDFGLEHELFEFFSFYVDGYKFMPSYKSGFWDGKARLYDIKKKLLPLGLLKFVEQFVDDREIDLECNFNRTVNSFTTEQIKGFSDVLKIHSKGKPISVRDYQIDAVTHAINSGRSILLSPTSCLDPEEEIEIYVNGDANNKRLIKLCELKYYVENYVVFIDTPTGLEQITDVYTKSGNGRILYFENFTSLKCADNHLMLNNLGKWVEACELKVFDLIDENRIIGIETVEPQTWIDFTVDAEHQSYIHKGITHHNSGKSLMMYMLVRWYLQQNKSILIIVPTTTLVSQLYEDFADYSSVTTWNVESNCHMIYGGREKNTTKPVVISTWQSIYDVKQSKEGSVSAYSEFDFARFDVILGDECHLYAGDSAKKLFDKCVNAYIRIGTTGTLNGKKISELQLTGLIGEPYVVTTTIHLMNTGQVTPIDINCLVLNHKPEIKKDVCRAKYQDEMKWLTEYKPRNNFISKLALSLEGVTLVLFNYTAHGKALFDMMQNKNTDDRNVHFINGSVKTDDRDVIRRMLNTVRHYRYFYFNEHRVKIYNDDSVPLSDGNIVKGFQLDEMSDISDDWILQQIKNGN